MRKLAKGYAEQLAVLQSGQNLKLNVLLGSIHKKKTAKMVSKSQKYIHKRLNQKPSHKSNDFQVYGQNTQTGTTDEPIDPSCVNLTTHHQFNGEQRPAQFGAAKDLRKQAYE